MTRQSPVPIKTASGAASAVDEEGNIQLRGRIKDAQDAIDLYDKMWNDDRWRSRDRALIDELLHNFPAKTQSQLAVEGRKNESNVNWGDGPRIFQEECAPYIPLPFVNRTLFTTPIKRLKGEEAIGTDQELDQWEDRLAELATDTIRQWPDFLTLHIRNVANMKAHGVSFWMFDDTVDWRPVVHSLHTFKIPNETFIGKLKCGGCEVRVSPSEIWRKIKDEKAATAQGWNVPAARRALMEACPGGPTSRQDWEAWELYWKNKDIMLDNTVTAVSSWIYVYVEETDGSVSQYIARKGDSQNEFIYKSEGKYAKMSEWIHVFIDSIPMKGTIHEIRGVGFNIFSKVQEVNRKINRFSDLTEWDATPRLQPNLDVDGDDMELQTFGFCEVLPPGWTEAERKTQNYQQNVIPAIGLFQGLLRNSTSRQLPFTPANGDIPKHLMDAQMLNNAQMSDVGEFLYYQAAEGLYREILRRLCSRDYDPVMPGGVQAAEFRRRCAEEGIPVEAIYSIDFDRVTIERVIGGGNANVRAMKLTSVADRAENLDPVGRNWFEHDLWASILGEQAAQRYVPIRDTERLPTDAGVAQNENFALENGGTVEVLDGQDDIVHAQMHLMSLGSWNDMLNQGQIDITQATPKMRGTVQHTQQHLQRAPANSPIVKQMVAVLGGFIGVVENGEKQIMRLQERAQREAAHNNGVVGGQRGQNGEQTQGGNGDGAPDPQMHQQMNAELLAQSLRASILNQQLQHKIAMSNLEQQRIQAKTAQEMRLKDATTAAQIMRDNAAAAAKRGQMAPTP